MQKQEENQKNKPKMSVAGTFCLNKPSHKENY